MSTINSAKKKMGRPKVDSEAVNVRLERSVLTSIDNWARAHKFGPISRPEAIRQLITIGLGVSDGED